MPRPDTGTKQKLIDTATQLIWMSSYGSVSVDDICKAAGVKKGSFYHYFPSKDALAITAMEEHFSTVIEPDLIRIFAANLPFEEQVDQLAAAIIAEQERSLKQYGCVCGCPLAAMASEMIGQEAQTIRAKAENIFAKCHSYMERAIKAAIDADVIPPMDAEQKSREVNDFITGLMMMARIHNNLDGLSHDLKPGLFRILNLKPILKTTTHANGA